MVTDDIKWDNLENEDALIGISSSLQASRPFPFHGREGTSGEPAKMARTIGPPEEPIGADGSTAVLEVPAKVGGSVVVCQDPMGASPSA